MNTQFIAKTTLLYWLLVPLSAQATTLLEVPFEEIVTQSAVIFQGQVISKEVREFDNGYLRTFFTFRIDELIKGNHKGTTIELGFSGGKMGNERTQVSGMRMPKISERGVYFVADPNKPFVNPLLGWHQGHYIIRKDAGGKDKVQGAHIKVNIYQTQKQQSSSAHNAQSATDSHSDDSAEQSFESLSAFKRRVHTILKD